MCTKKKVESQGLPVCCKSLRAHLTLKDSFVPLILTDIQKFHPKYLVHSNWLFCLSEINII